MRILQVLPHLSKGGAERVVVELSNSLFDAGHDVTVLLAFPVDPKLNQQDLYKEVSVQFVSLNSTNRVLGYFKLPFYVVRHWKILKTYDVIHCHLTFGLIFGFLIALNRKITRTNKQRLVATCHVVGVDISRTRRIMNERLSYFFDVFALMAIDAQWRKFISVKKSSNVHIVVNGISPTSWNSKKKFAIEKPIRTIGTISRLQSERKPWLFLDVFSQVYDFTNGQVRFILGGDGPERENLTALSERLKLSDNLSMPGLIQDPKTFLESLDLYVGLNVEKITGIAGLEAIFSGIPIVSIQLSPTYTNGANDWIWSDQDPGMIAEEIARLLKNPNELVKIAKDQHIVAVRDYSIERMRDSYLSHYSREK
jgi:glycosyltransferase involved in cell wall biosynthesis